MRVGRRRVLRPLLGILVLSAHLAAPSHAQEDETLISGDIESGYFSAPVLKLTSVDGATRLVVGTRGAWVANRDYALGGGVYWMIRSVENDAMPGRSLRFGYTGVELEYIHDTEDLVHFTGQLLLGAGAAWLTGDGPGSSWDWLFVAEPQANVELNVAPRFRVAAGLGYRLAAANSVPGISNGDLGGITFSLTFKSGSF